MAGWNGVVWESTGTLSLSRKLVLGWIIDTVAATIELPPHRKARLLEVLDSIKTNQKRVSAKQWHKLLGELRSMTMAIPGGQGLFSTLQEAFRHPEKDGRLRLRQHVHDFLQDFRWLAKDIAARPTRIAEAIPAVVPDTLGANDAAAAGMGGVLFVPDEHGSIIPLLWRQKFASSVQRQLISFDNPKGTITNSDLELAGSVAQQDVLAQAADIREKTIHTLCDNTPAVYWQRKGSTTTTGPVAYLLRLQSIHQRHYRYAALHDHIPGEENEMADLCSRAWHLSDQELLTHFDASFPQEKPWRLCHLRKSMNLALTSALFRKRSDPASLLNVPAPWITIGTDGMSSVCNTTSTHSSDNTLTQSPSCRSSGKDIAMEGLPQRGSPFTLGRWRTPYRLLARSMPAWGPLISERIHRATSTSGLADNYDPTNESMLPQNE